jgi:hypothetical protein
MIFLVRTACAAAAVCVCFSRDDQTNIHVAPRGSGQCLRSDDLSPETKNGPIKVDVDLVLVPVPVAHSVRQ